MNEEQRDVALRAANAAITGRHLRAAKRFASIELRAVDQRSGVWELAAIGSVALTSLLFVLGIWYL